MAVSSSRMNSVVVNQNGLPYGCEVVPAPFKVLFMRITPEGAAAIIEKNNLANRNVSDQRTTAMRSDIQTFNWKTTHQGLAFDENYNVIDGGHRLVACRDSGVPIVTMVSVGVPLDVLATIDNTRPRSVSDHVIQMIKLNPDYAGITTAYAAVAGVLEFETNPVPHLSMDQKLALVVKYKEPVEFAIKVTKGATGVQATSKAVVARAFYTQDHEKIKRFFDVYRTELPADKSEWAATTLKKFLTQTSTYGWNMRKEVYQKTESALWNFLRGIPMSKVYGTEKEMFPLPGDL